MCDWCLLYISSFLFSSTVLVLLMNVLNVWKEPQGSTIFKDRNWLTEEASGQVKALQDGVGHCSIIGWLFKELKRLIICYWITCIIENNGLTF